MQKTECECQPEAGIYVLCDHCQREFWEANPTDWEAVEAELAEKAEPPDEDALDDYFQRFEGLK